MALENQPRWLKYFYLFDKDPKQIAHLKNLKETQLPRRKKEPKRAIRIIEGDFNEKVSEFLNDNPVSEKEATFCLLDQRTFECKWATLGILASHKSSGLKIELFYFLAQGWLSRAIAGQKDHSVLDSWWGRDDWAALRNLGPYERADLFAERIKEEFGYNYVTPWPIFSRADGGRIMYYMIHASHHPEAPILMSRAYNNAVAPKEPQEQLELEFNVSQLAPQH